MSLRSLTRDSTPKFYDLISRDPGEAEWQKVKKTMHVAGSEAELDDLFVAVDQVRGLSVGPQTAEVLQRFRGRLESIRGR